MDTSNLDRVEFLKGPSSIMSGLDAIGGSVNYVTRQPTTGPIKNEFDTSFDSLGTYRTHYGSGGSTTIDGLDYRVDIGQSKVNSFIDGDYNNLTNFSAQLNYRVNDSFKVFGADRVQAGSGARLLGHAADHDRVLWSVLHTRRGLGLRGQCLRRQLALAPADGGFPHADHQL